jgi:hypothetical protein
MKMVRHKANQKNPDRVKLFRLGQLRQKPCSVPIIAEDQPPLIPAGADVVNGAWKLDPEPSSR